VDLITLALAKKYTDKKISEGGGLGGYEIGDGLVVEGNSVSVDTAESVEEGNSLPISSAAVNQAIKPLAENIEQLSERQTVVVSKAEDVEEEIYYIDYL